MQISTDSIQDTHEGNRTMKLVSWNVNGLRACMEKGFSSFLETESPDIIALQETKMQPDQAEILTPG